MTDPSIDIMSDMSQEDSAIKMSSTPSPTASNPASSSSASRRPPRKSTLTQQQKNQKRQRATQDQLVTLEMEFNKNPTPTATVRERIAEDINMTERSVQIWFQNRRAKIKLLAKKSIETGEDCDIIPDSMRSYLALQDMDSGKSFGNYLRRSGLMPYGNGNLMAGADQGPQSKVVINHLQSRSLSIGTWRRVCQHSMDLIVFYSPDKGSITYYINNEQAGYKIEYPFSFVKNVFLENGDTEMGKPGGLVIELIRPPHFFMDSSGSGGFFQCGDFTEDHQASQVMIHHLGGNPKVLSGQLAKLVSLDSFMNRHNHMFDQQQQLSASAPVSPTGLRPSSQPSYHAEPHVGIFQEGWGVNPHANPRGPGHKRQRSRSVPNAVDFSMFNNPMPSFFIQHPNEAPSHHNPDIFAPVPQQPNNLAPGSSLRIDTSTGYGMDFRQYPMSAATTANSPSEFAASPGFFSQGPDSAALPASYNNTPFSLPYLSPNPIVDQAGSMIQPSVSPLSFMSNGDPAIVNQSPPLAVMHRSASADMYSMSHDHSNISDDGTGLNEMYSKHTLNLPMHPHSPAFPDQVTTDMEMSQLVSFDDNSASLSPENIPQ